MTSPKYNLIYDHCSSNVPDLVSRLTADRDDLATSYASHHLQLKLLNRPSPQRPGRRFPHLVWCILHFLFCGSLYIYMHIPSDYPHAYIAYRERQTVNILRRPK